MQGSELERLVEVIDTLRSTSGCPWYHEQTHASLAPYVIEEAHELVEAIEAGDGPEMLGELGDVLLQVVLHARLAQEDADAPFGLEDVARASADKLIERNPHVFGDATVADADEVRARYEAVKARTMSRASVLDGVPVALPALQRAQKVLGRAERAGVAHASVDGIGGELLALVARASAEGVDAEAALRDAVRAVEADVRGAESDVTRRSSRRT